MTLPRVDTGNIRQVARWQVQAIMVVWGQSPQQGRKAEPLISD